MKSIILCLKHYESRNYIKKTKSITVLTPKGNPLTPFSFFSINMNKRKNSKEGILTPRGKASGSPILSEERYQIPAFVILHYKQIDK